jgi:hypothetical protein
LTKYKFCLVGIIILCGIIATTCALFIGFDGSEPVTTIEKINGVQTKITQCAYMTNNRLLLVQGIYLGAIFSFGFFYSWLIRRFSDMVSGSHVLSSIMGISCFSTLIIVLALDAAANIEHYVLAQTVGISVAVLLGLGLLIFPPFYKILKMGDHVANKDYIDNFIVSLSRQSSKKGLVIFDSKSQKSRHQSVGKILKPSLFIDFPVIYAIYESYIFDCHSYWYPDVESQCEAFWTINCTVKCSSRV